MPRNVVVDAGPIIASLPMSLADACLVRMTEVLDDAVVMPFDADFRVYRRHRRAVIPLLAPEGV